MLRSLLSPLLLGALAVSAAGACKGGDASSAPEVQPGVAVGKVTEVSGGVTATRSGTSRPLAAGAAVSGDDVIATGSDGRVTIVLAHNNAVWDLGPGKSQKVADSMAWQMAKVEARAGQVDETTTAAGRHAERSAASAESAAAPSRADEAPQGDTAPTPAAANMPSQGSSASPPPPPAQPVAPRAEPPPPPPPPPAPPSGGAPGGAPADTGSRRERGPAESQKTAKSGAPNAQVRPKTDGVDGLIGGESRGGPSGPSGPSAPSDDETPVLTADEVKTGLSSVMPQLVACVAASGQPRLTMVLHVKANKTTIEVPDGKDADRACVAKVAAKIKLNGIYTATMTIKK